MSFKPFKCAAKDFNKNPFYLIQKNEDKKRFVVSLKDKLSIRIILAGFINEISQKIEIKIRDFENKENPIDYSGMLEKNELHKFMLDFENAIFNDGAHDFMIKNNKTDEYIVFDEHGLIFIYTEKDYSETLNNLKAKHLPKEKLIYSYDHWHFRSEGTYKELKLMIELMKLKRD